LQNRPQLEASWNERLIRDDDQTRFTHSGVPTSAPSTIPRLMFDHNIQGHRHQSSRPATYTEYLHPSDPFQRNHLRLPYSSNQPRSSPHSDSSDSDTGLLQQQQQHDHVIHHQHLHREQQRNEREQNERRSSFAYAPSDASFLNMPASNGEAEEYRFGSDRPSEMEEREAEEEENQESDEEEEYRPSDKEDQGDIEYTLEVEGPSTPPASITQTKKSKPSGSARKTTSTASAKSRKVSGGRASGNVYHPSPRAMLARCHLTAPVQASLPPIPSDAEFATMLTKNSRGRHATVSTTTGSGVNSDNVRSNEDVDRSGSSDSGKSRKTRKDKKM
jgi:hypothetical protein